MQNNFFFLSLSRYFCELYYFNYHQQVFKKKTFSVYHAPFFRLTLFKFAYNNLYSLLCLFIECLNQNQQIYYLTQEIFESISETILLTSFSQMFQNKTKIFWELSNQQSAVDQILENNLFARFFFRAGLVLNFSLLLTTSSILRYLQKSDNIVSSVGLQQKIDYPLYIQQSDADQFLLFFFQRFGTQNGKQQRSWYTSLLFPILLKRGRNFRKKS